MVRRSGVSPDSADLTWKRETSQEAIRAEQFLRTTLVTMSNADGGYLERVWSARNKLLDIRPYLERAPSSTAQNAYGAM